MKQSTPCKKPAILVVEDETILRMQLVDMLDEQGFEVREAADADEALRELEADCDIELLMTDIQMPGACDGLGLIRTVHERWPHLPIMVTSGRLHPSTDELPGGARFVAKPINEREVLKHMSDLISARHGDAVRRHRDLNGDAAE